MSFTEDDLLKTARLAHIKVTPEQQKQYMKELTDILDQVKTINALDLEGVEPMTSVVVQDQYVREDIAVQPGDLLLEKNAPKWEGDAFCVPPILNK